LLTKILDYFGYIKKDKLSEHIIQRIEQARIDEFNQCESVFQEEKKEIEERFNLELEIEIQDRESKLRFQAREIEYLKSKVKEAEEIYNVCWKQIRSNLQIAAESQFQFTKLKDIFEDVFQSIVSIGDKAEQQNIKMLKHDDKFRTQLQLPPKKI
jgi:hydroxymethylpyrimidine pyrophosphatase-like HAD family hydrolase